LKGVLPSSLLPKGFEQLLGNILMDGELAQQGEWLHLPGFAPTPTAAQARDIDRSEAAYREAGSLAKNKREMLDQLGMEIDKTESYFGFLFSTGRLVRLNEESFLDRATYEKALILLREHFAVHQTLTLAQFRDLLGSARKQVQALLEHFDALKYTMRKGDERVAWKLPEASCKL
jgi:selenocysteine-specific elongation factor